MNDIWRAPEVRQQRLAREAGRIRVHWQCGPCVGHECPLGNTLEVPCRVTSDQQVNGDPPPMRIRIDDSEVLACVVTVLCRIDSADGFAFLVQLAIPKMQGGPPILSPIPRGGPPVLIPNLSDITRSELLLSGCS